ncbi:MAG: sulfotransferase domain-containing protein [Microcoleaceae cyanobacterium]
MKNFILTKLKAFYPISYLIHKRNLNRQFQPEILRLADKDTPQNSHDKSILFFTAHKCASVYVNGILRKIISDAGIIPIDFARYLWQDGRSIQEILADSKKAEKAFKPYGYFYGSFREFQPIPNLEKYQIILMLRDPRDVLTSLYFSHAYSHEKPSYLLGKQPEWRTKALSQTLDEFVIANLPVYKNRYTQYTENLLGEPNILFLKYEQMVSEFENWLDHLVDFLLIEVDPNLIQEIKKQASLNVKKENIYAHKRQVTPGDHQRKLQPDTVELLNSELKIILEKLDYH